MQCYCLLGSFSSHICKNTLSAKGVQMFCLPWWISNYLLIFQMKMEFCTLFSETYFLVLCCEAVLVSLVVLRDVALVGGAVYKRASILEWKVTLAMPLDSVIVICSIVFAHITWF